MRSFKDNKGREWRLEVTVGDVRAVRDRLQIDLPSLFDDNCATLGTLLNDPVKIVDVCWVLCEAQAYTLAGVNRLSATSLETPAAIDAAADFGRSFAGDALEAAADSLVEAIIDFFPNARQRDLTRNAMEKVRAGFNLLMDRADQVVQTMDPSTLSNLAFNSVQSPESTTP